MYWEFSTQSGQQAVRYGKWKGVKTNLQNGPQPLQLYNLEDDIKELANVSNDNPDIVKKIESIILNARTTPSLEKFKIMLKGEAYSMLLNHKEHNIKEIFLSEDVATFEVIILNAEKEYFKFKWQVEKFNEEGPLKDCWLTTAVSSPISMGSSI